MTMKTLLLAPLFCGLMSMAQSSSSSPAPTNIPGASYPRIHSDLTATFQVSAPDARKVQLLLELGQSTYDMVRGKDGNWTVTTKPILPGFHYYAIAVDGFAANDPGSRVFFAARKEVSGLEVPSPESDFFAVKDLPHGAVRTEWYRSGTTGTTRRIFVYTPPGYDASRDHYPVLYLQHGFGEDEAGWTDQGKENFILDNLIASRRAVPMIVVNENGMTGVDYEIPAALSGASLSQEVALHFTRDPYTAFERILCSDLIPFIDSHYRTLPDREHRALAGLSMGGAQAIGIGLRHLDKFAYIGAFSPAISIPDTRTAYDGRLADPASLNSQLRLLWIGIGRDDFLYQPVLSSHQALQQAGIKHVWVESAGAHVWTVWRKYLSDFAGQLFH